jgi:hypothetical protein
MAVERDVLIETREPLDRSPGTRVSWSGVFGGVIVGVGTLLLLTALGLAVGITAVDPLDPNASAIGTGAAIWSGLSLLISLFVGGWSAARMSMLWDRTAALFQGTLVWALSMLLILWLAASGIGLIAGQAFGLASNVAQGVGSAVANVNVDELSAGDVDQILARLRDPQTQSQIATATGIPQQEVSQSLAELSQRIEVVRDDPAQVAAEARRGIGDLASRAQANVQQAAARAQPAATATAWTTFIALLLALGAAMAGAAVGRRNAAERASAPVGAVRR